MKRSNLLLGVVLWTLPACGGDNEATMVDAAGSNDALTGCDLATIEQRLATALDGAANNPTITSTPNFTLLLESEHGRRFTHSVGNSTATMSYESASTSKLVAAVVLLNLVEQGALLPANDPKLTLDSKPSDLIAFWTGESAVTLRDLLSFRSGFNDDGMNCISKLSNMTYEQCVQQIYNADVATAAPGTVFEYSSAHLQIAGLMAMKVTNKTWAQIFDAWKTKTGLFPTGLFDEPKLENPRLAGGMHWTGEEYLAFLRALAHGTILSAETRAQLFANQRGSATLTTSPILLAVGEDWSYGFGNWLECPGAIGVNTYNCGDGHRNSSPGAYGAYPFIDFDQDYFGILSRQGRLGTFQEGLAIMREIEDEATEWAVCASSQ